MQNSLEILLQQLQDAELGGFDAQKDYAPPYRSLLTQEEILAKMQAAAAMQQQMGEQMPQEGMAEEQMVEPELPQQ